MSVSLLDVSKEREWIGQSCQELRSVMPAYNSTMVHFCEGKKPVVTLNVLPVWALVDRVGLGRISAQYRQLALWGFQEAYVYDCSRVKPESVNHAILDGTTPEECQNCPLMWDGDKAVFCPIKLALAAYAGRKRLEAQQEAISNN